MIISLIGFSGCGKSHYGKEVSNYVDAAFIDGDALLLSEVNEDTFLFRSIRHLYLQLGKDAFRKFEEKCYLSFFSKIASKNSSKHLLFASGGGCIESTAIRDAIHVKSKHVVYITTPFRDVMSIYKSKPNLVPDQDIEHFYNERNTLYSSIATISTSRNNAETTIKELMQHGK